MTCPVCQGAGEIGVVVSPPHMPITREYRDCPMGCMRPVGGVSGNMTLEGRELDLSKYRLKLGKIKPKGDIYEQGEATFKISHRELLEIPDDGDEDQH